MPSNTTGVLSRVAILFTAAVALYAVLIGFLLTPPLQRFALYAHKINTLFRGDDLSKPEAFGFAKHQVTPFNLRTPDGETLFAWHILPTDVYARHEKALRAEDRPHGPVDDFTATSAFSLLTGDDPAPAKLVVTCKTYSNTPSGLRWLIRDVEKKSTAMPVTLLKAGEPIPIVTLPLSLTPTY